MNVCVCTMFTYVRNNIVLWLSGPTHTLLGVVLCVCVSFVQVGLSLSLYL